MSLRVGTQVQALLSSEGRSAGRGHARLDVGQIHSITFYRGPGNRVYKVVLKGTLGEKTASGGVLKYAYNARRLSGGALKSTQFYLHQVTRALGRVSSSPAAVPGAVAAARSRPPARPPVPQRNSQLRAQAPWQRADHQPGREPPFEVRRGKAKEQRWA